MKAQEMAQEIYKAQEKIQNAIAQAIADELNALSIRTELDINGIDISLIETTTISDSYKTYAIQNVSIHAELPNAISGI